MEPDDASPTRPRILVVDDDTFLRMLVSMELPETELIEATRAEEAYELALEHHPDAILLDLRLPDADGLELLRRLRRTAPLRQTPILVITAGHDEARRSEVIKAGADEYLAKPIEPADLVARLQRILAIPAGDRRERRHELLDRLEEQPGDPDPVPRPEEPEEEPPRGLRRLLRRRG